MKGARTPARLLRSLSSATAPCSENVSDPSGATQPGDLVNQRAQAIRAQRSHMNAQERPGTRGAGGVTRRAHGDRAPDQQFVMIPVIGSDRDNASSLSQVLSIESVDSQQNGSPENIVIFIRRALDVDVLARRAASGARACRLRPHMSGCPQLRAPRTAWRRTHARSWSAQTPAPNRPAAGGGVPPGVRAIRLTPRISRSVTRLAGD